MAVRFRHLRLWSDLRHNFYRFLGSGDHQALRFGAFTSRLGTERNHAQRRQAKIIWACSVVRTVLARPERKASPTPDVRPRTTAKNKFRGTFGSIGPAGGRALSTMRNTGTSKPAETPASLVLRSPS